MSAVLARNEAASDRYLRRVLTRLREFSDAVLVLDDGSTDDTAQVARDLGCVVETRDSTGAWGTEAPARRELWERGASLAGPDGWLLVADADMILCGDPRPLTQSWECAAWAFVLYDLWNDERLARCDGPWGFGPVTPRPWLFKPAALCATPIWNARGVHCGHAPANFGEAGVCGVAPPDIHYLHYAYLQPEHRVAKHAAYKRIADQLSPFERQHADSILDRV